MKILLIDSFPDGYDGWEWNNWYTIDEIKKEVFENLKTNREIIKYFRDMGFLGTESKGKLSVYDDQFNIIIQNRNNNKPILAIEYGSEY